MLILGHRGTIDGTVAQNSRAAFEKALAEADGFETDACLSRDGEIFLIHEAKYVRAEIGVEYCMAEHLDPPSVDFLGPRRMDELTAADVRRLRLKDGQPLPSLLDAVRLVGAKPGKILNIELKAYGVAGPVAAFLKDAFQKKLIAPDHIIVSSFNHPVLAAMRRELPQVGIGAIFISPDQPDARLFPWHPEEVAAYSGLTREALRQTELLKARPDYIVMPQEILTAATLKMIAEDQPQARLAGWVFTEKGDPNMRDLLARLKDMQATEKIAAMIVDRPAAFAAALRDAKLMS